MDRTGNLRERAQDVRSTLDLATLLRELHRRHARAHQRPALTYREIAAATGWSHGIVGEYFTGNVLPTTNRLDQLVLLLGATPAEVQVLATARDRLEDERRNGGLIVTEPVAPRQLPPRRSRLIGRDPQLTSLDALISAPSHPPLAVILGPAGVGKSALAIEWAHRASGWFPDGQLFVDLRGFHPGSSPVEPADAVVSLLASLGVSLRQIPDSEDARIGLYRSLMSGRRRLILLDNARSAEQVRPLIPGSGASFVLVTSRVQQLDLVAVDGAVPLSVGVLDEQTSYALLQDRVGVAALTADLDVTAATVTACAGLPLALSLVAARAMVTTGGVLSPDPLTRLTSASDGVLSWTYRYLSLDAARAFRLLGLHPGGELSLTELVSLFSRSAGETTGLMGELADAYLVEPYGRQSWRMHDVMRAYAANLIQLDDPSVRDAATARLDGHYAVTACLASRCLDALKSIPVPDVPPGVVAGPVGDTDAAVGWLESHADLIRARIRPDATDLMSAQLASAYAFYLSWTGQHSAGAHFGAIAISMANALGQPALAADARRRRAISLASVAPVDSFPAEATHEYQEALRLSRTHGLLTGVCRIGVGWACGLADRGEFEEAESLLLMAVDAAKAADSPLDKVRSLNTLAYLYWETGRITQAEPLAREGLSLLEGHPDDVDGLALITDTMGCIHLAQDRADDAIDSFQRSLELTPDPGVKVVVWAHLAQALAASGDQEAAAAATQSADETRARLGGNSRLVR